ncbi:hypothetical protein LNP00_02185 [Fructobacillus sp. M158]|uniref:DUF1542 domain-containing protein n=1 Tax=Fructobacillus parabroussonetiae TaxID=2713174 RepID=UPI00200AF892|nr:DUF1542 domain-containing protein [Fructobacillus parabroussonetiae]MCK8617178.1 hypothetical protein [Fructobacillus parabroussonetiae]
MTRRKIALLKKEGSNADRQDKSLTALAAIFEKVKAAVQAREATAQSVQDSWREGQEAMATLASLTIKKNADQQAVETTGSASKETIIDGAALEELRQRVAAAIHDDASLSQSEKQAQQAALKSALQEALIDLQGTEWSIEQSAEKEQLAQATLTAVHRNGDSLDNRLKQALNSLRQVVEQAKSAVNAREKVAFEKAFEIAKDRLNASQSADAIATVQAELMADMTGLHQAKQAARENLEEAVSKTVQAIDEQKVLTKKQKAIRRLAIVQALAIAQVAIDGQTSIEAVHSAGQLSAPLKLDDAQTTLQEVLDEQGDVSQLASLTDLKKSANQAIEAAGEAAKKDMAEGDVDAILSAVQKAQQAVQEVANADQVVQAETKGIQTVSRLEEVKNHSRQRLTALLDAVYERMQEKANFSSDEKKERFAAIQQAYQAALEKVRHADQLSTALAAGDDLPFKQIIDQQENQNLSGLKEKKQRVEDRIRRLADQQKADASLAEAVAINQVVKMAHDALVNSQRVDDLLAIEANTSQQLKALPEKKAAAKTFMTSQVQAAKARIQQQKQLEETSKTVRIGQIESALMAALATVDNQVDLAQIPRENEQLTAVIDEVTTFDGATVQEMKEAAKKQLRETADAERSALPNAQKVAMEQALSNANQAIDQQSSADELVTTLASQLANLNGLNNAKYRAYDQLNRKVAHSKTTINQLSELTAEEKIARIHRIRESLLAALQRVDLQTTVEAATEAAQNDILAEVLADCLAGHKISLSQRKDRAIASLFECGQEEQQRIEQQNKLSKERTVLQKNAIQRATDRVVELVKEAVDADAVDRLRQSGLTLIAGLNPAKDRAMAAISLQGKRTVDQIKGNDDLTTAEKQRRIDQVKTASLALSDTIDREDRLAAIQKLLQAPSYKQRLNKAVDYTGVRSLANQQKLAKEQLQARCQQVQDKLSSVEESAKQVIGQQDKLTLEEKKAIGQSVNRALEGMLLQLTAASTADSVEQLLQRGEDELTHLVGEIFEARRHIGSLAEKAKQQLQENQQLSADDRRKRNDKLLTSYEKALNKTNAKSSRLALAQAGQTADFEQVVADLSAASGSQSLADRRDSAMGVIQKAFNFEKELVTADSTLAVDEANCELTALEEVLATAKHAVEQAVDAKAVDAIRHETVVNMQGMYEAKRAVRADLVEQKARVIQQIRQNRALLDEEKEARIRKITGELRATLTELLKATNQAEVSALASVPAFSRVVEEVTDLTRIRPFDKQLALAQAKWQEAVSDEKNRIMQRSTLAEAVRNQLLTSIEQMGREVLAAFDRAQNASDLQIQQQEAEENRQALLPAMDQSVDQLRAEVTAAIQRVKAEKQLTAAEQEERIAAIQTACDAAVRHVY